MKTYDLDNPNDVKKLPKVALLQIIKDVIDDRADLLIMAQAFDALMRILNNDAIVIDATNSIQITHGHNTIEIPVCDEDYETLRKAMEVNEQWRLTNELRKKTF